MSKSVYHCQFSYFPLYTIYVKPFWVFLYLIKTLVQPGDADSIDDIVSECDQGIKSIMDMEKAIVQLKLHGENTSILTLEHTLLDLSSNPQLTQATFYMLPIYTNGKLYIRYKNSYFTQMQTYTHTHQICNDNNELSI